MASVLLSVGTAASLGGIFDDTSTPSGSQSVPRSPSAPPPPVPATSTTNPADTANKTSTDVTEGGNQSLRRAVPDRASQIQHRSLFEEVYAAQLKDQSPAGRRALALLLLSQADKTVAGSADRFVLISGAIRAAKEAQSLRICFDAIARLASEFDVEELQMKADVAKDAFAHTSPAKWATIANIEALMDLADQLKTRADYTAVSSIESELQRALSMVSDPDLGSEVRNHIRELTSLREAAERITPVMEKLKKAPQDTSANLAAGSYLCFVRRSWNSGLPLLAKSDSAQLKSLATAELAHPTSPTAVIKLADGWFAAAPTLSAADRGSALLHAIDLYRSASSALTGLEKIAVDARIARAAQEVPPKRPRRVDLLDYFDPSTSVVKGRWQMERGSLESDGAELGRVQFAYQPPEEYDFTVSFTVLRAHDAVTQIFFESGHQFVYQLGGWANTIAAFEFVDGIGGSSNRSAIRKNHWLSTGRHYTSIVKVRRSGLEAYLDGQLVTALKTDYSNMGIPGGWRLLRDDVVGVAEQKTLVRFDLVEITELTGKGRDLIP